MRWGLLPAGLLALVSSSFAHESFNESLWLSSLQDGKLLSSFEFRLAGPDQHASPDRHHVVLPGSLLALFEKYGVESLSLALSSGRYLSEWPTPTATGVPASGVELLAYLQSYADETEQDELERWNEFKGALSGVFCTGLLDARHSSPHNGFGANVDIDPDAHRLYRVLTPRLSAACTESLTPFLALLPCRSRAGIASLLNPYQLFDGDWTLLAIHYGHAAQTHSLNLQVGSVVDPVRQSRLEGQLGKRDFSFSRAFDRQLDKACPVAQRSEIELELPKTTTPFKVLGAERASVKTDRSVKWDVRSVLSAGPLDVGLSFEEPSVSNKETKAIAPISVRRLLHGTGQERGRIGVEMTNHLDVRADLVLVETWDWWLRPFISQMTLSLGHDGRAEEEEELFDVGDILRYEPAIARERPTTLELAVHVPARSTARISVPYESAYMWYTEYSSDAHRGVEVRGAMVALLTNLTSPSSTDASGRAKYRTYTGTTLVSLPTPDFSMPYNVIILTSTVIALFFGNVVNRMMREWHVVDLDDSVASKKE